MVMKNMTRKISAVPKLSAQSLLYPTRLRG